MSAKKTGVKDSDQVHGQTVTDKNNNANTSSGFHPTTSHASASARARLASLASHFLPTSSKEQIFDYVIVGGGTAGAVIANRLTEDRDVSVAVIEGGPSDIGEDRLVI